MGKWERQDERRVRAQETSSEGSCSCILQEASGVLAASQFPDLKLRSWVLGFVTPVHLLTG
jgi:hypothetical protein